MKLVTDRGVDITPAQSEGLDIHYMPLLITLDGKTYRSGEDIQPSEFYDLLTSTDGMPTTSLPSPGEFAEYYRELAKEDPDILSIHISSGLSGTYNAARMGAEMVPEANITLVDTKTLSGAAGWQVVSAARAIKEGWAIEKILAMLKQIGDAADTMYTLPDLKYLIHGGRISHISGLLAQALKIKPIIGVEKVEGIYEQLARVRTFSKALNHIGDLITRKYEAGSEMLVQVMHAQNYEGAEILKERIDKLFKCTWLPDGPIAPVLGAHTGPGMVGAAFAPTSAFPATP